MQRNDQQDFQEQELARLRKLVEDQQKTISALQQEVRRYQQAELHTLRAAIEDRNDADRFERTKNNMTRYGRHF